MEAVGADEVGRLLCVACRYFWIGWVFVPFVGIVLGILALLVVAGVVLRMYCGTRADCCGGGL